MIRRPPRSTRTDTPLSLHDALPVFPPFLARGSSLFLRQQQQIMRRDAQCDARADADVRPHVARQRSEEHTSELQSLMRNSYAVFCLKKTTKSNHQTRTQLTTVIYVTHERHNTNHKYAMNITR